MHVVLVNQYYPPDEAPTGRMLEAVAERLAAERARVTVVCGPGGYAAGGKASGEAARGASPRVEVRRVWATRFGRAGHLGRIVDYASFFLGVAATVAMLRPKPERIVALTTPPFLSR